MQFDLAALISFLPQFVIGGVVAIYFFITFRKLSPEEEKLEFLLAPPDGHADGLEKDRIEHQGGERSTLDGLMESTLPEISGNSVSDAEPSIATAPFSDFVHNTGGKGIVADTQLILLTLDLWILVSLLLSPVKKLNLLLPSLPSTVTYSIYVVLAAVLGIAVLTTVVSRISVTKRLMAIMLVSAGALTFAAFYAPSMSWITGINGLIHLAIVYSAVVIVCMAVYTVATYMKRKPAFSASAYTSFASYGITAFILLFNLFTTAFQ